jgi:hypothetical protein
MFSPGGSDAKTGRRRLRNTKATPDATAGLLYADPVKALVMTCLEQLAADGHAEWSMLDNGDVELRFSTGETFLLAENVVIRLA